METDKTPPAPSRAWHKSRMLLRNPVSLAGMALAIVSLANIFLFFLIDQIAIQGPALISAFSPTWCRRHSWFSACF